MPGPKKPSFKDALQQVVVSNTQLLKIDVILDRLPDDELPDVLAALLDPAVAPGPLAKALNLMGHSVTDHAVKTWRANPEKRKNRE